MYIFSLISEGFTDHAIIDGIISEVFTKGRGVDVEVNYLQPLLDATDRAVGAYGGWELVFRYCESRIENALVGSDFVVIHLDTDSGSHPNFDIKFTECGGGDRRADDLINDVKAKIIERISSTIYTNYANRIIFAISVHSIESWVLLLSYGIDSPKQSFRRLCREASRRDDPVIIKDYKVYRELSRKFKQRSIVKHAASANSLGIFLRTIYQIPLEN